MRKSTANYVIAAVVGIMVVLLAIFAIVRSGLWGGQDGNGHDDHQHQHSRAVTQNRCSVSGLRGP